MILPWILPHKCLDMRFRWIRSTRNILNVWLTLSSSITVLGLSCGIDNSPVSHVYEGFAKIETYPWLGILYYPYGQKRFTTAVVLVTRQIVLAAATEIDKLPKADFRSRARVVIGYNCSGPHIGIRDYSYHPDYTKNTYSALTMIQLETDRIRIELRPICPPPAHFSNEHFYAMVLSDNCRVSKIRIHKMKYVSPEQCKNYYRRTGLDLDTMWPSHTACARSMSGGRCVWRSGAILVVKLGMRWRLLGFGVYGPGCQAPARFLDYGMYHTWVQHSVERIGRPSISTLGPNHIVMRRSLSNVQRYGPCDRGEIKRELYTDNTRVTYREGSIRYNISIYADVEYSCIVFRATYMESIVEKPRIHLQRWCAGATGMCYGFQFIDIHFYVEIHFKFALNFHVKAYGREAKIIDPGRAMKYMNRMGKGLPFIESYKDTKAKYIKFLKNTNKFPWYRP